MLRYEQKVLDYWHALVRADGWTHLATLADPDVRSFVIDHLFTRQGELSRTVSESVASMSERGDLSVELMHDIRTTIRSGASGGSRRIRNGSP